LPAYTQQQTAAPPGHALPAYPQQMAALAPAAPDPHVREAAAHWLAVSDPDALDELASGNSAWPMLCCACTYPEYILARAAMSTGLLSREAAFGGALFVFALLVTGTAMETSTSPAAVAAGIFFQLMYLAAIFGATFAMRRHMRALFSLPGSSVVDCLASIYPCSVWGLTVLDRQASPPPLPGGGASAPVDANAVNVAGSAGKWSTPLWGCLPHDLHTFQCAAVTPWFMQLRLLVRLGTSSPWLAAVGLFVLYDFGTTAWSANTKGSSQEVRVLLSMAGSLCLGAYLFVSVHTRARIRARYGVEGSTLRDVAEVVCCHPCALAQMDRQTTDLARAPLLNGHAKGSPSGAAYGLPPAAGPEAPPPAQPVLASDGLPGGGQLSAPATDAPGPRFV
jgi:Cys-rich protein (TIGR01571 family)